MAADMTDEGRPAVTERVRVRRRPERGSYDPALVRTILDEALMCRVAFVEEGTPVVMPMSHFRLGDTVYVHGSHANRTLRVISDGATVCLEATVMDGLALSRAVFQNSVNYRSVVAFGQGHDVLDPVVKREAMEGLVERLVPGRLPHLRPLTDEELRAVRVVGIPLTEASAKVRTGPAKDLEGDHDWPVWAGEVPLRVVPGAPVPDPYLPADVSAPEHVLSWGEDRHGV